MRKLHLAISCFCLSILTYSANACHYSMTDGTASKAKRIEDDRLSVNQGTHDQRYKSAIDGNIFKAVWNVPRNGCQSKFGVDLELDSYDIEANAVGTSWNGKAVTIFYNEAIGLYPAYEGNSQGDIVKINAGLPQLTNLTQHFEKATSDIITEIPDPDFTGLAIIDWEKWFPQWDFPGEIMDYYRGPSLQLVRERHPEWDEATVELVAKVEYEQSAKALMEGTLLLGKRLRPRGQWGFYHHPYCYNKHDGTSGCKLEVQQLNDYIPWLFRQTTAYFPSIYLPDDLTNNSAHVEARLGEAMRVREEVGDVKSQDMFAYCRFNYTNTNLHYNLEALNATILTAAENALSGVVIWGDHYDTNSVPACLQLKNYIHDALGPTVKLASEAATNCSLKLCSGHGRCKGNIVQCGKAGRRYSRSFYSQAKARANPKEESGSNNLMNWIRGKFGTIDDSVVSNTYGRVKEAKTGRGALVCVSADGLVTHVTCLKSHGDRNDMNTVTRQTM